MIRQGKHPFLKGVALSKAHFSQYNNPANAEWPTAKPTTTVDIDARIAAALRETRSLPLRK